LLFGCVVARQIWEVVSECVNVPLIVSYESMAKLWLCNKKFGVLNMVTSAVCWGLWKLRNVLCFQDIGWRSVKQVWWKILPMLKCWKVLVPLGLMENFEAVLTSLERLASRPERITLPRSVVDATDGSANPV
jgi:hypothetical protein